MTDMPRIQPVLRRPRLLIDAARAGLADYRRDRDLARITGSSEPRGAVAELLGLEAELESTRRSGATGYRPARHVEVMIALLAEAFPQEP